MLPRSMKIERQLESTPCKIYHRVTSRQKNRFGLASSPVPTRRSLRGCSESWATSPQKQNAIWRRITDGMRADWEANRDELMEFWRSGESELIVCRGCPGAAAPTPSLGPHGIWTRHGGRSGDA